MKTTIACALIAVTVLATGSIADQEEPLPVPTVGGYYAKLTEGGGVAALIHPDTIAGTWEVTVSGAGRPSLPIELVSGATYTTVSLAGLPVADSYEVVGRFANGDEAYRAPLQPIGFDPVPMASTASAEEEEDTCPVQTAAYPYSGASAGGFSSVNGDGARDDTNAWVDPDLGTGGATAHVKFASDQGDWQSAQSTVWGGGATVRESYGVDLQGTASAALYADIGYNPYTGAGAYTLAGLWLGLWDYDEDAEDWQDVVWKAIVYVQGDGKYEPEAMGTAHLMVTLEPDHVYYAGLVAYATVTAHAYGTGGKAYADPATFSEVAWCPSSTAGMALMTLQQALQ